MASNARKAFDANMKDINALVDVFETVEDINKDDPSNPVPQEYDVVLRSGVVLLVTYWEAYIEDIVAEAVEHLVNHVKSPNDLPKKIRKNLAAALKQDKHDLAIWKLAGDGWREELKARLAESAETRGRNFNTPKSQQTIGFISSALGIEDVSKSWTFDGRTSEATKKLLDQIVVVRGKIAHRGKLTKPLTAKWVTELREFLEKLISKTGGSINTHLKAHTGKSLW
jgi:hypothetical protein